MKFGIGQPVSRLEDPRFLTGNGQFLDDLRRPGQLCAVVLRADQAHGRLTAIDAGAARGMPGVHLVWTAADIAGRLKPLQSDFAMDPPHAPVTMPHLATETVRFVGQPIAFVVAESRAEALDAAEAIEVEIESLPAVVDPEAALADGAPCLHPEAPGNVAYRWSCGDADEIERLFAEAAHVVSASVLNQRVVAASMEPRGILMTYADGAWEGWVGSQGAHGMRAKIARALGVEAERVRIHVPDVGGGFGMKLMDHPEYALCALAAQDLGRPIKWVSERSEAFLSDVQGRDLRGVVDGAFDAEGRCLAMRMRTVSGLGGYLSTVGAAIHSAFSAPLLGGMYAIQAMRAEVTGVFTNTPPTDAYRGAGRPETLYFTERLMEAAARQIGIDRVEIRRRNLLTPDRCPHATPGGFTFDSLDPHTLLDRAIEAADYAGFPARAKAAEAAGRLAGIAVVYYFERTGGGPAEKAKIRILPDGTAEIAIGTQSTGQGHATAWAQILHETLGLDPYRTTLLPGDTAAVEVGGGTGGSRSAKMASRVLFLASDHLIEQGRRLAADRLEAAEADIEFEPSSGGIFRIAGTDRALTFAALAAEAGPLLGEGEVGDRESTFPNGCHVAEVEVERETGVVTLTRYTAVDDFGRLINPLLVTGQVHGGIVQGLGQVLGEAARWDAETGQPITGSFMDYQLLRAGDVPNLSVDFVEVLAKTNPLGVKGCGEAGSVGGIPAGALAVLDAFHRGGVAPIETPFTPERVWAALHPAAAA